MTLFETSQAVEKYRERCEDRVAVMPDGDRVVLVVADGAGGSGCGQRAAETVIREIPASYLSIQTAEQWNAKLTEIDLRIDEGESTVVVVDVRPDRICGASVGDSQAWIVRDEGIVNLTARQVRKPLLGSRDATPIGFMHDALAGILLVASDGFWNYMPREKLLPLLARTEFVELPRACIEAVRLPSGELWDDTCVVACRVKPLRRTRQRYAIWSVLAQRCASPAHNCAHASTLITHPPKYVFSVLAWVAWPFRPCRTSALGAIRRPAITLCHQPRRTLLHRRGCVLSKFEVRLQDQGPGTAETAMPPKVLQAD
jgi:serine/threonine protein phosphatase PrpC